MIVKSLEATDRDALPIALRCIVFALGETVDEKECSMPKLMFYADHEFSTFGVWVGKGSKKAVLTGKKATEYIDKFGIKNVCIYVYTAKHSEQVTPSYFDFSNAGAQSGAKFTVMWNESSNLFNVTLHGKFERELDDTDMKMLFADGQTVVDIGFAIQGLIGGEIWNKGFISKIGSTPQNFHGDEATFPEIKFEFVP